MSANGNVGPGMIGSLTSPTSATLSTSSGTQLQLNALKAMGVQAITVEVGFPISTSRSSRVRDRLIPTL